MEQESSLNIFENTNYNFNRVTNQSLVIDVECGTNVDFSVNLQEPLIIDKLSDVYLDSITTFNCKTGDSELEMGFLLKLEDFPIKTASNNPNINRNLFIPNEQTTVPSSGDGPELSRSHKGKKLNYICNVNPMKLTKVSGRFSTLNITHSPFIDVNGRFILELAIIPK